MIRLAIKYREICDIFFIPATEIALIQRTPNTTAIVCVSPGSAGIHTFIIDQRLSPVNVARNKKKKPIYHQNQRNLYERSPSMLNINIRLVNLMLKAKPISIPIIKSMRHFR